MCFRRNQLEVEAFLTQQTLLAEFLTHLKRLKDDQLMQLRRETSVIQADLDKVNKVIQVRILIIADNIYNTRIIHQKPTSLLVSINMNKN